MKSEFKKSLRIAALFAVCGLFISFFVFFLFFGKGLQIILPCILFFIFFIVFLLLEKLPFVSKHPIIKLMTAIVFIVIAIIML